MLNRIAKLCLTGLIITLLMLFYISYSIKDRNYDGLNIAIHKSAAGEGADIREIEKVNENKLMITYFEKEQCVLTVRNLKHDITLISTNYTYPFVCKYQMLRGGFFTRDNQDAKNKYSVLNQAAAFKIFRNMDIIGLKFEIDNEEYIIRGVINDDKESPNIYVPMLLTGQNPSSLLFRTDEKKGITIGYVKNELKRIGISEGNYQFINIGLASKKIAGKAAIALMIFSCCSLVLLLLLCVIKIKKLSAFISSVYKKFYLKELIKAYPGIVSASLGLIAAVIIICTLLVLLLLRFAEIYLTWRDAGSLPPVMAVNFEDVFVFFQRINRYTDIIFMVFILFIFILMLYCYKGIFSGNCAKYK